MATLAMDLGGTKLATAVFSAAGDLLFKDVSPLNGKKGDEVGGLITAQVARQVKDFQIEAVGVSVPGISRQKTGTVWAPNIEGWEDYPLLAEIKKVTPKMTVVIDSDRACSIFGEQWQGNARGCKDAIFIAVGTGIGAGIINDGRLVRGASDIAGAVGWMALQKPFDTKYIPCGCFEYQASGAGIPKVAKELLDADPRESSLRKISGGLTALHVFEAFEKNDAIASAVIRECVGYWGMAAANLVSIFNPQKIIFGGGLFGPAAKLIDAIKAEAEKWAQPISVRQVSFERSALGGDAAVYGAGFLAIKHKSFL